MEKRTYNDGWLDGYKAAQADFDEIIKNKIEEVRNENRLPALAKNERINLLGIFD